MSINEHMLSTTKIGNIHEHNIRHASAFSVVHTQTSSLLQVLPFISSSVPLWNLQPDNSGLSLSIQAFFLSFVPFCFTTQFFYMKTFHSIKSE